VNLTHTAYAVTVRIRFYLPASPGISLVRRTPSCPTASVVLLPASEFVVSLVAVLRLTGMTA